MLEHNGTWRCNENQFGQTSLQPFRILQLWYALWGNAYDRPGCIEVNIADSSKCAGDNDFVATRQVKLGDHKLGQWAAVRGLEILAHFACHRWSCIQMLVKGEKIHTYNWPSSEIIGIWLQLHACVSCPQPFGCVGLRRAHEGICECGFWSNLEFW